MPAFTLEGFESPEEVQARIGKAEQAALRPTGDINSMIYQTAAQGGAGIVGGLAQGLGYEDPAVKKARQVQDMLKDLDPSTSKGLYEGSQRLMKAGFTKEGADVANKALEVRKVEGAEGDGATKYGTTKMDRDGITETWLTANGIPKELLSTSKVNQKGTVVKVGGGTSKELLKHSLGRLTETNENANIADTTMADIDFISKTLVDENGNELETGGLSEAYAKIGSFAASAGIKLENVDKYESAGAAMGDLVMGVLGKFKGAISNAEREFAAKIMPKLSQTAAGRKRISEFLNKISKRAKDKHSMLTSYLKENEYNILGGEGTESFDSVWRKHQKANPLFPDMGSKGKDKLSVKRNRLAELRAKRDGNK